MSWQNRSPTVVVAMLCPCWACSLPLYHQCQFASYLPVSTFTEILPCLRRRTKSFSAGYCHLNSLFPRIHLLSTLIFASDHPVLLDIQKQAVFVHYIHLPPDFKMWCSPESQNCYAKFSLISSFNFLPDNLFIRRDLWILMPLGLWTCRSLC